MEVKKVLIYGPGQMGNGIAHVMAAVGIKVLLKGRRTSSIEKGMKMINGNCDRAIKKGTMTEAEKAALLANITTAVGEDFTKEECDVDMVMEAISEDINLKKDLFLKWDALCPERTIFATNTSSLPVTALAAVTSRPEKVVGMHFFSPVFVMRLVEVINGLATDDETMKTTTELSLRIGKNPVPVNDYAGFVANRIMCPMMNEAAQVMFEGVADAPTVDACLVYGFNHPIGPVRLMDAIGLDTMLHVMEILHREFGDDKYRPSPLMRKYVEAGWLGKKTGRGFYNDYK